MAGGATDRAHPAVARGETQGHGVTLEAGEGHSTRPGDEDVPEGQSCLRRGPQASGMCAARRRLEMNAGAPLAGPPHQTF